jgi:hypothetical protein
MEGSLSAGASACSSPRTAHTLDGLRSPVIIKTLAKAALQVCKLQPGQHRERVAEPFDSNATPVFALTPSRRTAGWIP